MNPSLYQVTKELLLAYNRYPRKKLGQHFLVDPMVLERILRAAELSKEDLVVEVGSGLGVVTTELGNKAGQVIAVEIDKELVGVTRKMLANQTNIRFVEGDILKVELDDLTEGKNCKIVGNLPYYITAPIIEKIFTAKKTPALAVLMVQREVADRMTAAPGAKKYGSFSIFTQFHAEIELVSLVSKSSFLPWPQVGSAIVQLRPYQEPKYPVKDVKLFFAIVHAAFQQRRKKIRNSLAKFPLENIPIDLARRPETLSINEFVEIADYCYNQRHETQS